MKKYTMFEYPTGKIEAVKQGWSWPGFFFTIIWAFFKRMWMLGGILVFAEFVLPYLIGAKEGEFLGNLIEFILWLVNLIMPFVFGANGNHWREQNLLRRGYECRVAVTAATAEGATALYIKNKQAQ